MIDRGVATPGAGHRGDRQLMTVEPSTQLSSQHPTATNSYQFHPAADRMPKYHVPVQFFCMFAMTRFFDDAQLVVASYHRS